MFSKLTRRAGKESIDNSLAISTNSDHHSSAKTLEIDCRDFINPVAFLVDGGDIVNGDLGGKIRRWRAEDGKEVGKAMDAGVSVFSLAVSRDGEWLVSGTFGGRVTVWNAETHEKVREIMAHAKGVYVVDISPDSRKIATGSNDKTVCLWSLHAGKRLLGPLQHNNEPAAVKFSSNGERIATAMWDHYSIRIYDSQDGHLFADIPISVTSHINQSLAWSSDGKQLFASADDGTIKCVDVSTGAILFQWSIHSSHGPRCIALAGNGKFIVASSNRSISCWDTTTHEQIGTIIKHNDDAILSIALSANYDLASGGGKTITLCSLYDILPPYYVDEVDPREREIRRMKREKAILEKTIDSLHAREGSGEEVSSLRRFVHELRYMLTDAQETVLRLDSEKKELTKLLDTTRESAKLEVDRLKATFDQLGVKTNQEKDHLNKTIDSLRTVLRAHEEKHECEVLYAEGRITDAAELLREITNTASEEVRANKLIMDWINEFAQRCVGMLERVGDAASNADQCDKAIAAYSTALSLSPSTPSAVLMKWISMSLTLGSAKEALNGAAEFKIPMFLIYQGVCDFLEGAHRMTEAIECFQQMKRELAEDANTYDKRAQWEFAFQRRCTEQLEQLGDVAMDCRNYDEAVEQYSSVLTLNPMNLVDILVKRSKARVSMGWWDEALDDANEAIKVNPSCHRGYEAKHAALHGAGHHSEAVEAFKIMLLKLEQSPDPHVRELRHQYVDAAAAIRSVVEETIRHIPRVLIYTTTGRLHDKKQQAAAFETLPIYTELLSSMTTQLDHERVSRAVKKYYRYVMFSHRWELDEPLLQKVENMSIYELEGSPTNIKLQTFCSLVRSFGFRWAWSDTCCVDKLNHVVLQESLVAMFTWYRGSSLTVIYLRGVWSRTQEAGDLWRSIWNTRAWTFQEYVASKVVKFYTEDWKPYLGLQIFNHKESPAIISEMERATGVSAQELVTLHPGLDRVREKLYLASMRQTTLVEDIAYSLFGIFNVAITVIYGEGNRAVGRLLEHVLTGSGDVTILAWTGASGDYNSCLPAEMTVYNQLPTLHVPSPINNAEMGNMIAELCSSFPDLSLAMDLYDQLNTLPIPSLNASRLKLPGIAFPLIDLVPVSTSDSRLQPCVYHATTSALGEVEIRTKDDIFGMKDLILAHPWISSLLDQEFLQGAASLDKLTRALRFVARLRQPFGALLLVPLSRVQYRRVAADALIVVRVREEASLMELMENIRTIDIQ